MKFIILCIVTASAMANVSSNTSQTNMGSSVFKKLAPSRVTYFSEFFGPSLGNGDRVDEKGNVDEGSINTWNQVSFGWDINENLRFVVNPRFSVNHNSPDGESFEFVNPVFGIGGTWYQNGKLVVGGGLNTIIPQLRTQATKDDGILFNPGGFQFVNYQIDEKFSVGSWIWGRAMFYDGTENNENRLSFFVAPLATYSFNDKVSVSTYYWIDGGQSKTESLRFSNTDKVGFMGSFTINKLLTVQPIISFFQRNGADLSKANLNVWFSGRFF